MESDTIKLDTEHALRLMDKTFHDLYNALPDKPEKVQLLMGGYGYRFKEKSMLQAIIQKLAFVQSTLNATKLLLDKDFVIEPRILKRTIDEANEDIYFLSLAVIYKKTELHARFLIDFWEENIEKKTYVRRKEIRKEIHDYLKEKIPFIMANLPSYKNEVKLAYNMYSKFVHSTSPCIMKICRENPPRFCMRGIPDTPNDESRYHDINLSIYWSLIAHIFAIAACIHSDLPKESLDYEELVDYLDFVDKENKIDDSMLDLPK